MPAKAAYLGDTPLPGPASYLAGLMTQAGLDFVHQDEGTPVDSAIFEPAFGLYILSDFASAGLTPYQMERLCEAVEAGAGVLMLGGWTTYHGLGGDWDRTPLADLLPVQIAGEDDRRNCPQPVLVRKVQEHPILSGLPFDRPAGIGGYNAFTPRPDAQVLLEGERYEVTAPDPAAPASFTAAGRFPLLVTSQGPSGPRGAGRRACLATDVAPHWVGGWVDWGAERLTVRMKDDFIEVGCDYARFFTNLVAWTLGEDKKA